MNFVLEPLKQLIESLRDELREYGEMLALLDKQQGQVVTRVPDEVLQIASEIGRHSVVLQTAREKREAARRDLARQLSIGEDVSLSELLPLVPADYRPLLQALVEENNELLFRIQQRARQNHLLLSRSVELMQNCISSLFPGTRPKVYGGNGGLAQGVTAGRLLYEAVG